MMQKENILHKKTSAQFYLSKKNLNILMAN